jgi:predicted DNA-binding WGR domain protein
MGRAWINSDRQRYYAARVETDLLGFAILECYWGSTKTNRHGGQCKVFKTVEDADETMEALHKRRVKRGYQSTS